MKRAQMEIMGLAIIVILISVGILFAIRFVVMKEPASYKKGYTQAELASNMLTSILHTTSFQCNKMSFTDLFQHCANYPSSNEQLCGTRTSCQFLNSEVKRIFRETLGKWSIRYYFEAKTSERNVLKDGEACQSGYKSKQYPIPLDTTGLHTLFLTLNICD